MDSFFFFASNLQNHFYFCRATINWKAIKHWMKLFIGLKKNILLPDSQIIVIEQKSGKAGLKLTITRYSKLSKDRGGLHSSRKELILNSTLNKSTTELNRRVFFLHLRLNILIFWCLSTASFCRSDCYLDFFSFCLFQSWHFTSYLGTVEPWNYISLSKMLNGEIMTSFQCASLFYNLVELLNLDVN